jgi:hypothetical protein
MNVRDYVKQKAKRDAMVERQFEVRMRKALTESLKFIVEEMQWPKQMNEERINMLYDPEPIDAALKWLYVDWGYKNFKWFKRNLPFGKKQSDEWLNRINDIFIAQGGDKIISISETALERIKPILKEAIQQATEGASIDKIQKYIADNIKEITSAHARVIARTEVISASNTSTYEAVKSTGVKVEKKWLTGGLNIRPTHRAAEAQGWIPFDEKFTVGAAQMSHPGDPSVKNHPEEICNCKCVLIFRGTE